MATRLTRAGSLGHTGSLLAACWLAGFIALALAPAPAWGAISSTPDRTYVTNGTVYAIARSADRIYLGGSFDQVGPRTGPAGAVSASTATADLALPQVSGGAATVNAIAPDGSGGFYIGGDFTHVGGVARHNAAHVRGDKTVDPTWNPNLNAPVLALTVSGSTVYLGGVFTAVNGTTARNYAAAVNATSGLATAWNPDASSTVEALAVSGATVYLGGGFQGTNSINGQFTRNYAAAVNATTGIATAWDPDASNVVDALAVSGSTVYLGGSFTAVGGTTLNHAAAVDGTSGSPKGWNPDVKSVVRALAVSGSTVYLGGSFTVVGGTTLNHAAAVDATSGSPKGWNPDVKNVVRALAVSGSTVYLGGDFNGTASVNTGYGTPANRNYAASVDATTGLATAWNPNANGAVRALAVSGSTVYLGGDFTSVNGATTREHTAAVAAATGAATGWNPAANGLVYSLAVSGSTVYLGGVFSSLNTQTRRNAAALSAADGTLTAWNPVTDGPVYALAVSGSTVYLGGGFGWINNSFSPRPSLGSVDATTGAVTLWQPGADGAVRTLVVSGSTVYAGGDFQEVGPGLFLPRLHAAQFQASGYGTVTGWNPNLNGSVYALAVSGSTVYLGGDFTSVNGSATRNYAAAVTATTAAATPWDPNAGNSIRALAISGSTVYVGGYFTSVNGTTMRNYAAATNATTGTATVWNPNSNDVVRALAVSGSTVYLGGDFTSVNGSVTRSGLASVNAPTGAVTGWDPEAHAAFSSPPGVQTLTLDAGGGVLAGGAFATLDLGAQQGIASFSDPPANTALPAISGTAAVKHTLSCSQGSWSGTTPQSYAYQWLRGTAAIPSATTSTYAVPLADAGAALACRVTATNLGGSTQAVSASVVIPGPPVVSGLTLRPMKFRAARSGGPVSPHGRSRVSYRLTAKATTTFTVQRALPGKRKGSSCVKPTKRLRHARKCTRFVRVKGSFSRATGAGKRSFGFTGRLRGHPLRAGMYRLSATAVDANGLRSKKTATHRFRIAR